MDRRARQAQTTVDRYFYKFISCYVQAKHGQTYNEALALYKRARAENPGVKDLVKTATYMRNVHPEMAIPRYYLNRNLKQQQRQPNLDNSKRMMLCIPLTSTKTSTMSTPQPAEAVQLPETAMSTQPAEAVQLPETAMSTQPAQAVQLPETAMSTQPAEAVQLPETAMSTQPAEAVQLPETAMSTQPAEAVQLPETAMSTQPAEAVQLPLSTEIYEGLLKELQTDPELTTIFNNFPSDSANVLDIETSPFEQVQTDPELTNILDNFPFDTVLAGETVFWVDEISPLEQEVQTMLDKTQ